ncbi:hypothetical protein N8756_02385 [Pseudomonadales bacterium]|nr:hypothetical protein [Pseudomonadales bacterium]MDA8951049.1 hypothetical protein [Pseudomonadales bacterium]
MMLEHEGAIRSNQDPLATPLLASKAQGSLAFDSTQFDDFIRFFLNLNLGQKTTKRSLPGIVIKELLMLYWFEKSQSLTVIDIKNTLPIDPKLIDRLLAYFLRCGTYRVVGDQLLPTTHQIEKIRNILIASDAPFTETDDRFGFRVRDPLFSTVSQYSLMYLPFEGKLSGQYHRADMVLWRSLFNRPKFCLRSHDIATKARIPKSTLSTLLETARVLEFVTQQKDPNDCRVLRWRLNPLHPTFHLKAALFRGAFFANPYFANPYVDYRLPGAAKPLQHASAL